MDKIPINIFIKHYKKMVKKPQKANKS